ncbi:hypothetical protein CDAR_581221 [Caerostris darwini]|uniref:Uncharacterized protein n=1 Tax=Caerostris darwini TaxID=1538125 RepID=A0AAV4MLL7_9ARAC|nr:hypothetical protein CDAR_581221 [Caerostris darwini]
MLPKTPSRQKRYAWDTLTILHQQNLSISSSEPRFIMANRVVSIDGPAIRWWPSNRTCCTRSQRVSFISQLSESASEAIGRPNNN